jgi:hypothetical protein
MRYLVSLFFVLLTSMQSQADFLLARNSKAELPICIDANASEPELNAATDLRNVLKEITGADFELKTIEETAPDKAILVGLGRAAKVLFNEVPFPSLGEEELIIKTKGDRLLLAGGAPRGTLYAVSLFLQHECGVRWWTPWASKIARNPELSVRALAIQEKPAFELREPFWYPAFDPTWAVRNRCNGQSSNIPLQNGGCVRYKGFVHTFNALVPPSEHFAMHPEWFSLINGKRTTDHAQLCLTNPKLRDFVVERVKQWIRETPEASIVSVSQNDWHGACQCENCKALDDAEGSHAGTMLAFVNYIAEAVEKDFPKISIDTLAYQYTRKPPKTIKPRPNVIVRLCSIECNFREPLDHPSNAAFAEDIRGWSKISNRLYIWDYTTDFAHYVQPHPNWFVLGPNIRFFQQHNVKGIFEQGAYQSHGSEMAELRAWVLAQLLWNPQQDDRALIQEFVEGYYGPKAAPYILRYFESMHEASRGHNLTCYSPSDAPFLRFEPLSRADKLLADAEAISMGSPEFLPRLRLARLPVRYVWLSRWDELQKQREEQGGPWPLHESRGYVATEWEKIAAGIPGQPWTKVTLLSEGGLTPQKFLERFRPPAQ